MKKLKKVNHTIGGAVVKVVKNPIQAILALAVTAGFFTVLGILLFKDIPTTVKDLLLTLFGSLTTVLVQVYQFYFGSSKGSQEKTDVIKKVTDPKSESDGEA